MTAARLFGRDTELGLQIHSFFDYVPDTIESGHDLVRTQYRAGTMRPAAESHKQAHPNSDCDNILLNHHPDVAFVKTDVAELNAALTA